MNTNETKRNLYAEVAKELGPPVAESAGNDTPRTDEKQCEYGMLSEHTDRCTNKAEGIISNAAFCAYHMDHHDPCPSNSAEDELEKCGEYSEDPPSEVLAALQDLLLDVTDDEGNPGSGTIVEKVDALKRGFIEMEAELLPIRKQLAEWKECAEKLGATGQHLTECGLWSDARKCDCEFGSALDDLDNLREGQG